MKSDLAEVRNWLSQGANDKEQQEHKRRKQVAMLTQEADMLARDVAAMREAASIIERVMGPETLGGFQMAGPGRPSGEILPLDRMDGPDDIETSAPTVTKPWEADVATAKQYRGPSRG